MVDEKRVKRALSEVIDPEIGLNIVDLGLIYDIKLEDNKVYIKMTLTVPGCPLGNFIMEQAREKVKEIEGIEDVNIELVWDPPWNISMVSDEAKKKLGIV
ncbi:MAG TPA: metal-sulfur cluster assembly factor [Candidatus Atribacteria bacterium]|nr:metal-sulfur cluster assembly factor [Candidatus Atribacteria bacterium]